MVGTGAFAVTGALAAGRKRMDIFGVVVLGCVTALGGGTLRDLILGIRPVFWISNTYYLWVATLAAIGTYLLARRYRLPEIGLMYMDAIGLAVFTIIGFQIAINLAHRYSIAIVMGVTTGVFGGIIRDVLSAEVPLILRREIYASASLCGAAFLSLFVKFQLPRSLSVSVSLLTILIIRLAALRWNLALPIFQLKDDREETKSEPQAGDDA